MDGFGSVKVVACAAALLALLAPQGAEAKFPLESGASEPPPGITVTGIGFAPATATADATADAVDAAVRDARSRAAAIARALGLGLGPTEGIELPQLAQFGESPSPPVAAATVTYAILGGGSGEGSARFVLASGAASARVRPRDRKRSRSIKSAVLSVRRAVTPRAATAARRNAEVAAEAAGLSLGTIVSVSEAPPIYYGSAFYDGALGSFDPGRFCGIVRKPILRRNPETGANEVVRRVPRRRCFFPTSYGVRMEVRYEAS
jgi:hypothetical protein